MYEVFNSLGKAQTVILRNGLKNLMQIIILAIIFRIKVSLASKIWVKI